MRAYTFPALFLCLSQIPPAIAFDDSGDDLLGDSFFDEDIPIVLTASRLRQPLTEAPTAMTIINREMIENSGAREIHDLFRTVPGMIVGVETGGWPVVTYHGMSDQFSRRMQILIDGRAVYLPDIGGPDWSSLPLSIDDIERIEITRGSNAATYGSNSFMGVINIISRHSSESIGTYFRQTTGDYAVNSSVIRLGKSLGDLDMRLTARDEGSNIYNEPEYRHDIKTANFRADYQATYKDHVMFQSGYSDNTRNNQTGTLYSINSIREFGQLSWTQTESASQEIKTNFYYSKHKIANPERIKVLGIFFEEHNSVVNERYDAELSYTHSPTESLRTVVGASTRKDKLTAPLAFGTNETFDINIHRVFGTAEYRLTPKWLLHLGLMYEDHDYMDQKLSPRLSTNYRLTESQHIRLGASKAYRAPLAFEKYASRSYEVNVGFGPLDIYDFRVEPDLNLKAEEINSYEIGYILKPKNHNFTLDLRAYRERISSIITPYVWVYDTVNIGPISEDLSAISFDNMSKANIQGMEASLEYKARSWSGLLTYSYTDIDHLHTENKDTSYQYDKSAPLHKGSLMLNKSFSNNLTTSFIYHYVDDIYWQGVGNNLPGYERIDIRIGAKLYIGNNPANINFVVQNALTGKYMDFRDENLFTSRMYVTASVDFF